MYKQVGLFGIGKWRICENVDLSKIAGAGFSAVVEPSLETGGVLGAPLWGMMAEFGAGVCDGGT
ncbi:MAG: hypothetical protein WBD25_20305 [Terriglobales bacterium]